MAKRKIKAKKVEAIEIESTDLVEVAISEKDQIKIDLKKIQDKLNKGYDPKYRSSLLRGQQELQIKLKSL